jgi:hypothetical protein
MPVMTDSDLHAWWSELRHHGLVVAPALLDEYFPQGPIKPEDHKYQRLRERYAAFDTWYSNPRAYEDGVSKAPLNEWLEGVLDTFLGHNGNRWQRGNYVNEKWKHKPLSGEPLIPRSVFFRDSSQSTPALFVWVEPVRQLMHGRGRTAYGKLLALLRAKQVKLGLLTNGRSFRLCYAGIDHDSWVEWDSADWFDDEELRRRLYGFYTLLGPEGMKAAATSFPLLDAAEASRTRQGDLSVVMGEQIRQAVETLLNDIHYTISKHNTLTEDGQIENDWLAKVSAPKQGVVLSERRMLDAFYQAAVRMIMRMVVVLFAEARDMLPLSVEAYEVSYSLEGLYESLRRAQQQHGRKELEEQHSSWIRMLCLFTIIYRGSISPDLAIQPYGGLLFRPGDFASPEPVQRAVALFEELEIAKDISDATVLRLLELLKIGKLTIKQGRTARTVSGPVDFAELRTEYIGLMYQGLLDFNLHAANEPMVFLDLGQEPILPLATLEGMQDQSLKDLLKKLSAEKSSGPKVSEEEQEEDTEQETGGTEEQLVDEEEEMPQEDEQDISSDDEDPQEDEQDTLSEEEMIAQRALTWAKHALEVVGDIKKPKSTQPEALRLYEKELSKRASKLFKQRVLSAGEFYLTRSGGTRKGSGTFYTRPQLAVPIARRALQPLLYVTLEDGTLLPKQPEEILSIKVCDPACGSGAFLVAALHYITEALYESLVYHRRLKEVPGRGVVIDLRPKTLPLGAPSQANPEENLIPLPPDHEHFRATTIARLRRYVVEECIYGVDLSPLAVELGRMSLWIETMDRDLPFTFLDHKIKVGNALVGGWFDTFREYPVMAWQREGGDKNHKNGVNYKAKEWTSSIEDQRDDVIKPALITQIQSSLPQLFPEYVQETPEGLFSEFTTELLRIHRLPIQATQEREESYRALVASEGYRAMKHAFDRWCAAWFWPADTLTEAPTPANFYHPPDRTHMMVDELADELHFFHWELEFLDVFNRPEHGFDVMLANPPWETAKPSSKEFFSNDDLLYRTYGKQEALLKQHALFQHNSAIERQWLLYQSRFKSMGNWAKHAASPFGDPEESTESITLRRGRAGDELHKGWRKRRAQYEHFAGKQEPFRYQGSADLNTYKMFLEVTHHLLKQEGRLGLLVPSGIYTDKGSRDLRKLFLNTCHWEWIFGFINRYRIFEIHSAFKFVALVIEKGGKTEQLNVAFNQQHLTNLEHPEQYMFNFPRRQVERFSPLSLTIVELQTSHDSTIMEKLYTDTVLLGDQGPMGWKIQYSAEFHMTNDSKLFPPLPAWEAKGYRSDDYGRWVDEEDNVALPLYEGRMIGPFDPCEKGWVSGKGRSADWGDLIPFDRKSFTPQYLVSSDAYRNHEKALRGNKIGFMRIGSATNTRSMYAALVGDMPCGEATPVLQSEKKDIVTLLSLVSCLNSFCYDYALRCRLGGINLSYFIISEVPLIPILRLTSIPSCALLAARLNLIMRSFAPQWLEMRKAYPHLGELHWRKLWAITRHERLRLRCILDAIIAELYGLEYDDFAWILRDDPDNLKGFWRVDQREPQELRHTTLALAAFRHLKEVGLGAFSQEDWQFPTDVAEKLGPRFTPWQEEGSVEESWAECEMHAQRMKEIPIPLPETEDIERITLDNGKSDKSGRSKKGKQAPSPQLDLWSNLPS